MRTSIRTSTQMEWKESILE